MITLHIHHLKLAASEGFIAYRWLVVIPKRSHVNVGPRVRTCATNVLRSFIASVIIELTIHILVHGRYQVR